MDGLRYRLNAVAINRILRQGFRYYSRKPASKRVSNGPARFKLQNDIRNVQKPAKTGNAKAQDRGVFHYGSFGGLKEIGEAETQKTAEVLKKISDFEQLKILPKVRTALQQVISEESIALDSSKDVSSIKPSPIQVAVTQKIARTLMDKQLQINTIAAETGSGKTIAYLVPLLDYLKRVEDETPESWDLIKDKAIVRSVILVPTHELVEQVYRTVSQSAALLGLNAFRWNMNTSYTDFIDAVKNRIDVMVTTPGKILNTFKVRIINRPDRLFSGVKFVVLDEADTLMDKSWLEETHSAIQTFPNVNHLIFCSATIPNEFSKTMDRLFPTRKSITTPKLHKISRKIDFKLIDASLNPYKGSKMKVLSQILYAVLKDGTEAGFEKRCVVFVNEKKDAKKVEEQLRSKYGHDCISLTGEDTVEERLQKIDLFVKPARPLESLESNATVSELIEDTAEFLPNSNIRMNRTKPVTASQKKVSLKVLVTTDLMARGLNFHGIRNVILYDVPKTAIDLVHRAGRTGRMMQGGRVFMITDKKTKSWAKAIPKIVRSNKTLS
ncbi:ATP-dependent RNA helicase LALA0_S05e06194g [Lachancea lanzarotensis]|uniref:RNA helicase n=1 Tax=Lachancea lanzarotensis TaxID=1245769 RepID=A0A0C7N7E8_9SACH|nr:uncharacterized protein LALA0_S05e06194g [Lachancea lanzarotensis]CEP62462.1 LALA0S05e06194g1_1 [Lachancea lanzarotensis]